eukprot:SAG22_NODE_2183_length_2874_cov_1.789550_1_plen_98_part_10
MVVAGQCGAVRGTPEPAAAGPLHRLLSLTQSREPKHASLLAANRLVGSRGTCQWWAPWTLAMVSLHAYAVPNVPVRGTYEANLEVLYQGAAVRYGITT